ncbi:MAG TPA: 2Fe-2S iron-sulfur cluster-binding protein [Gaiella sp.]|nr:2Fe-2S iron-sulfur cluster-binding protein [Gaiella sp.]
MTDLVKVTIDDREVEVAKGTGLVETAEAAGIEIPVFCYEPRLGPAVGACRMCLVEVEGLPKLQAGCTLVAQDGMVVHTAATSARAAEGQKGTLEFILVNHPLDCPVCDKGGECPLQDLTFRYGPGSTRMTFSKLTFDKPIPVSPLIALDRERCILCYRCTRFSSDVAEDGQLIAQNRGAYTQIATFADDAYRAPFSGNVIELCPVGALTSTLYRFEARPWEIQDVPTVCGLCPVGCNIRATTREGDVKRVQSRNHPEVDGGWLCDKGRFAFPHLSSQDRVLEPLARGPRGLEPVSWDDALARAERLLRDAGTETVTVLSGSETTEIAYGLGVLLRRGLGAHSAVLHESTSAALDAFRAPLSTIGAAELVVVVGDDDVVDRAPAVDLWIRRARRNGADVVTIGARGSVAAPAGETAAALERLLGPNDALGQRLRAAERAVLVWSGAGGGGGARLAEAAHALGFADKPGCAAFHLPATPNARAAGEAWAAAADEDEVEPERIGLLVVSGDEAASDPGVRALAERAEHVLAISMFSSLASGWADLVLPATGALEREGTAMNVEGRVQRLRRAVIPPVPDELAWLSKLAGRLGVELSPYPEVVFEELSARIYGGLGLGELGEHAALPRRTAYEPPEPATRSPARSAEPNVPDQHFVGTLRLLRYRPLFSGPQVERVEELQFQRPQKEVALSTPDAARRGIATGDMVALRSNGSSVELRARVDRRLVEGVVRVADEHAADLHLDVEVVKA